ncbi:MAG: hypothetical protein EBR60_03615 [Burkholderiaceae bacterium]|nr:hypothetical protein [Burkholderiaceae bacterium]
MIIENNLSIDQNNNFSLHLINPWGNEQYFFIELPHGPSILKKAEIISECEIQFLYDDGSSKISKILSWL